MFRDPSWRAKFRENAKNPRPGMIFQGNWDRVMVAVAHKPSNAKYVNRYAAEIAKTEHRDPLDVVLDLSLDENLETAFLGRFLNVGDDGVARLLKHEAGVVALSDAGAHLIYMCDAGFGLHFLAHWVRERGDFDLVEGVRRLTSHPADLYGIPNRGRLAVGAQADMLLFDPATVGVSPAERVADLPGGGRRTIRRPTGVHGVFCNGVMTFDGKDYVKHAKGPGHVLDRFNSSQGAAFSHRSAVARIATRLAGPPLAGIDFRQQFAWEGARMSTIMKISSRSCPAIRRRSLVKGGMAGILASGHGAPRRARRSQEAGDGAYQRRAGIGRRRLRLAGRGSAQALQWRARHAVLRLDAPQQGARDHERREVGQRRHRQSRRRGGHRVPRDGRVPGAVPRAELRPGLQDVQRQDRRRAR